MTCPSDFVRVSLDSRLAASFRDGGELAGSRRIKVTDDRLWVFFPESDFVIQTRPSCGGDDITLNFSVAVRAPEPSLETWWDKWSVSTDPYSQAEVARSEILAGRQTILRMLADRFGARHRSEDMAVLVGD